MDVYSMTQVRTREYHRLMTQYPLDDVITKTLRAEALESASTAGSAALGAVRFKKKAADAKKARQKAADQAELEEATGGAAPAEAPAVAEAAVRRKYTTEGARRKKQKEPRQPLGVGEEKFVPSYSLGLGSSSEQVVRKQAEVVAGGVRTRTFTAVAQQFKGRDESRRGYPHELDPTKLRLMMGAELRTAKLNAELRAARQRKYDDDLRRMAELEAACEAARGGQQDGGKLKLGRIEQQHMWQHSGEMHRRGQVATWNWQRGFYVLCNGLLYAFTDSSLSATLVDAWPILGATFKRAEASAKAHPFVLSLTLSTYYVGEHTVLSTIELSAPTLEARKAWLSALEHASLKVSKLFKSTSDMQVHIREVDLLNQIEAKKLVGNGG